LTTTATITIKINGLDIEALRIIAIELTIMFKRAAGEPTHFSNAETAAK